MKQRGITKRVLECMQKIGEEDFEDALFHACTAVNAIANKEYPLITKVGQKYKKFVKDNIRIIGLVAFNISAPNFYLPADRIR